MVLNHYGVSNNAEAFLTTSVDAVTTTLIVDDVTPFTDSALETPFIITVSNVDDDTNMEFMKVTSVNGGTNELTVVRNTPNEFSALAHDSGSRVSLRVISQHMKDLQDAAVLIVSDDAYLETTTNANEQVSVVNIWEDSTKTLLLADCTYTYSDIVTKIPASAVRRIYKSDGTTVRRTETTTFTFSNGKLTVLERVIT